jgi:hypothetical protein
VHRKDRQCPHPWFPEDPKSESEGRSRLISRIALEPSSPPSARLSPEDAAQDAQIAAAGKRGSRRRRCPEGEPKDKRGDKLLFCWFVDENTHSIYLAEHLRELREIPMRIVFPLR